MITSASGQVSLSSPEEVFFSESKSWRPPEEAMDTVEEVTKEIRGSWSEKDPISD